MRASSESLFDSQNGNFGPGTMPIATESSAHEDDKDQNLQALEALRL